MQNFGGQNKECYGIFESCRTIASDLQIGSRAIEPLQDGLFFGL